MERINVAIIGQGRSGRDIHGLFFKSEDNKVVNVVAVAELDEIKRERAKKEYGCDVYEDYRDFYKRDDIDIVINAAPSDVHYSIAKDLLENGMNVIVEKPFARNRYECDTLIKLANDKGLILAVFQQSLLTPYYLETKRVVESGVLGDIKQIDVKFSGFGRRWDWQTLQCKMAGNLYNTGPHPVGLALGLIDFDKDYEVVYSRLDVTELSSGDSDDYAKIILSAPKKPVVDIETHSNDAFPAWNIKILGSRGSYRCTTYEYEMKYIVDGENPPQKVVYEPLVDEEGYPVYCKEDLKAHTESGKFEGEAFYTGAIKFYQMIYERIRHNTPLAVTPEQGSMTISVIEAAYAQNPMPIKF